MQRRKFEGDRNYTEVAIVIALIVLVAVALIAAANNGENRRNTGTQSAFNRVSLYYDDNNVFQEIVYDPDTMVMYAILDGRIMTPLYNADGSLKTYESASQE